MNMEQTFSDIKRKDVINLVDGKNLGRVCDITFTFPENRVQGFTVTGCKGFRFSKQEIFLPIKCVVKIGKDAVLVKFGKDAPEGEHLPEGRAPAHCCPPDNCPPDNCCPPFGQKPPSRPPQPRRSYEEYE